jgi:hypothetical protein
MTSRELAVVIDRFEESAHDVSRHATAAW